MSLLENPLIQNLIKKKLPEIIDNLDELENGIKDYINSFDLNEDETHITLFTDVNTDGKLFFCTGAFNKKLMVRLIDAKPAKEFIKDIINKALK